MSPVRVGGYEFDAAHAPAYDVIEGIAAAAANADHLYHFAAGTGAALIFELKYLRHPYSLQFFFERRKIIFVTKTVP
jgi:hypothetical protein